VYGWSVTRKEPVFARELSDDIVADPVTDGSSLFAATEDGKVHCVEIASRGITWTRALDAAGMLHRDPESLFVTTSSGKLLSLHPGTGETIWELTLGKGAVAGFALQGQMLYATLESGQLTAVRLQDRKLAWEYQCDDSFLAPPCILGDHLFVGTATGKLQFVEVGE
jgi:outer membrane protein assembly factor BamB